MRHSRALGIAISLALAAVLGTVGLIDRVRREQARGIEARFMAAEKRISELQAIRAQVDAFGAKRRLLEQKVDLIERLRASTACPAQALTRVGATHTASLRIEGLVYDESFLILSGSTGAAPTIDALARRLRETGFGPVRAGTTGREFGLFAGVQARVCREPAPPVPAEEPIDVLLRPRGAR